MTAEVVNLRKARKAKARAGREVQAGENRVRFGRSKAERTAREAEADRACKSLDGHRLTPGDDRHDPEPQA